MLSCIVLGLDVFNASYFQISLWIYFRLNDKSYEKPDENRAPLHRTSIKRRIWSFNTLLWVDLLRRKRDTVVDHKEPAVSPEMKQLRDISEQRWSLADEWYTDQTALFLQLWWMKNEARPAILTQCKDLDWSPIQLPFTEDAEETTSGRGRGFTKLWSRFCLFCNSPINLFSAGRCRSSFSSRFPVHFSIHSCWMSV